MDIPSFVDVLTYNVIGLIRIYFLYLFMQYEYNCKIKIQSVLGFCQHHSAF